MDWKSREITHHYNLRSLRGPRLRSRTRDQRNHNNARRSNSHLESSHHNSRNNTTQQQRRHRRERSSQRELRRDRSQGDQRRDGSQKRRRMDSTRRAHKALSDISSPSSDKPDEDDSDDIKCIICIDTIEETEMRFVRCGHSFHRTCINSWLKVNNACPICRTVVAPRRIFLGDFNRGLLIDDTPISDIIYFFTLSVMGDVIDYD